MRNDTTRVDSRSEGVTTTAARPGEGAPAGTVRSRAGAPVQLDTVVLPMAVYAEQHRGQDGTAITCPVCVEKVWYANTAYGYMKLTDYIEEHRDHTRPPRLEPVTIGQDETIVWPA